MPKKVSVTKETNTGKNIAFIDNYTKEKMTKSEFLKAIDSNKNNYQDFYHTRTVNGERIPCSNPDSSTNNNLG